MAHILFNSIFKIGCIVGVGFLIYVCIYKVCIKKDHKDILDKLKKENKDLEELNKEVEND